MFRTNSLRQFKTVLELMLNDKNKPLEQLQSEKPDRQRHWEDGELPSQNPSL